MILWRAIRRLLALGIRLILWRPALSAGFAGFAVLAVLVVELGLPKLSQAGTTGLAGVNNAGAQIQASGDPGPAPSVMNYLKGMTNFDAKLMWNALSTSAQNQMATNGATLDQLQQSLDQAKQRGTKYERFDYVSSYPLLDGNVYQFFVITASGISGTSGSSQAYFVFTIGTDGKIVEIH